MKNEQTMVDQPVSREESMGNPLDLDSFRKEIAALQAEEAVMKKTDHFTNGETFNPLQLTEADRVMWGRIKHFEVDPISKEQFEEYRASITGSGNVTRDRFAQFLANKLSVIWGREELKQMRASRGQLK